MIDIMDTLNSENKNCVFMGDMNIDLLKFGTHTKTADYLDNLFSHGFLPLITKPTRLSNSSATLFDHIYTNDIFNKGHSGIITTDVADHFGICYLSHGKIKQVKNQNKKFRIISEANMNKFKVNFEPIEQIMCPNEAYNVFMALYKSAFEDSFPLRNKSVNSKSIK